MGQRFICGSNRSNSSNCSNRSNGSRRTGLSRQSFVRELLGTVGTSGTIGTLLIKAVVLEFIFVQFNAETGFRRYDNVAVVEPERLRDDVVGIVNSRDALFG